MQIRFWDVGAGDAITIKFQDGTGQTRHIFVDGGYVGTYQNGIKTELREIQNAGETVDLWILTHTDRDHIGGVEAFIKDKDFVENTELVGSFWFNWSDYTFIPSKKRLSIAQGIKLRDYLDRLGKLMKEEITTSTPPIDLYGLKITILSPDTASLQKSKVKWARFEHRVPISAKIPDYGQTIDQLAALPAVGDTDVFNGGSLAFLLEDRHCSFLLLGDSHPSVIVQTLKSLGFSSTNRLKVNYVKLSHHASKRNTTRQLLELIDCDNYIVLANGVSHALPNKWTLANILTRPGRDYTRKTNFYFNNPGTHLKTLFQSDGDTTKYNFDCIFATKSYLEISCP